jgi:hypothetical protein
MNINRRTLIFGGGLSFLGSPAFSQRVNKTLFKDLAKKPKKSKIKEDEMVTFYIIDPIRAIILNDNTLVMPMSIS